MLTEKDYCDYETCVALKELGYVGSPQECECFGAYFNFGKDIFIDSLNNTEVGTNEFLRVPLYLAQKWLREEKDIIVYPEKNSFGWYYAIHYNVGKVHQFKYSEEYDTYEEALSEGIKEAVKLLKEKN